MKKSLLLLVAVLTMCLASLPAFAENAPLSADGKLDAAETTVYGLAQEGSLMDRTKVLELDLYGAEAQEAILERINNLYEYTNGNGADSFTTKLNAVDAKLNEKITTGPAKTRIETLETSIYGKSQSGSLKTRLDKLVSLAYPSGSLPTETITLPKDSLVKIEFTQALSSKTAKAGDVVSFRVADNVFVNDVLVLPKGAAGVGNVKKVVGPRSFGRDARIDLTFSHVYAIDGSTVPVYIGDLAKQQAKTAAGAAGATIGGMIIFGPIGAIGGAFVNGQSVVIPEGSTTYVQVTNDKSVNGVIYPVSK